MHEFVASARSYDARDRGVRAMDIGKRLIDYNFHAPTVYFPLIVPEAMMIEPTETESRETHSKPSPPRSCSRSPTKTRQLLHDAPSTTPVSRPDEVAAAKTPDPQSGPRTGPTRSPARRPRWRRDQASFI